MEGTEFIEKLKSDGVYEILGDLNTAIFGESLGLYTVDDMIADAYSYLKYAKREPLMVWGDHATAIFAYVLHTTGLLKANRSIGVREFRKTTDPRIMAMTHAYIVTIKRILADDKPGYKWTKPNTFDDAMTNALGAMADIVNLRNAELEEHKSKQEEYIEKLKSYELMVTTLKQECQGLKAQYGNAIADNKKLKEAVGKRSTDVTEAFCNIADRYMKANERKSQQQREKVSNALKDIVSQLKLRLPEDILKHINDFDNYREVASKKVENHISGEIINYGTLTGDMRQDKA